MADEVLLDTSVVVDSFAGEPGALRLVATVRVILPCVTLGELFYGGENSPRRSAELARTAAFASANRVLPCDSDTARVYGEIKHRLRIRGRPIPDNDIWIAALARQYGLALATRDAHFREVESLVLAVW